jgi:hypothetical protein
MRELHLKGWDTVLKFGDAIMAGEPAPKKRNWS